MVHIIGDIINISSIYDAGEGALISEFEWKWDGSIISGVSTSPNISFNTTGQTEGNHTLSLRVSNDCGNWSSVYSQTVELVEPYVCPIPTVSFILT